MSVCSDPTEFDFLYKLLESVTKASEHHELCVVSTAAPSASCFDEQVKQQDYPPVATPTCTCSIFASHLSLLILSGGASQCEVFCSDPTVLE